MSMTTRKFFFDEVTVDGNVELDFLKTRLNKLNIKTFDMYRIDAVTAGRPDLVSLKYYGTYDLGWLICEHNKFKDPINDLSIGRVIQIPSLTEYYQFYNRNTRKV